MLNKIRKLAAISRQLEPDPAQRTNWQQALHAHTANFLDDFNQHTTFVVSEDLGAGILGLPIEEEGKPLEVLLESVREHIDTPHINPASGGHFGYIPGGGVYTTALGDYLAAATNRYSGIFFACPGGVRMENMLLRWMCRMVGYPEGSLGNLTSGGSIANMMAITAARDAKGIRAREVEQCVVYLTRQLHHCVHKAL
ncbi:MAG: amino acid decarboxylase, partial [Lewinella sp.]|nr:amino acid decarboxylase [Lewinella sp.]